MSWRPKSPIFSGDNPAPTDGDIWYNTSLGKLRKREGGVTSNLDTTGAVTDAFPVGSLFIGVVSTNPNTLLGYGTWSAFGAGRVLVGLDSGDTDFDTVEETGGAKTVASAGTVAAPTFTGSALGTHSHTAGTLVPSAHAGTAVAAHGTHTTGTAEAFTSSSVTVVTAGTHTNNHTVTQPNAHTMSGTSSADSAGTPAGTNSAPAFTGSATSVVQPYIVVYMWKRTA